MNSFYNPEQKPSDKSDVIVRVYHMKLEELIDDIKSEKMFGPCDAGMTPQFIREFQSVLCLFFGTCFMYKPYFWTLNGSDTDLRFTGEYSS
jgi:hypothetical protein